MFFFCAAQLKLFGSLEHVEEHTLLLLRSLTGDFAQTSGAVRRAGEDSAEVLNVCYFSLPTFHIFNDSLFACP